MKTQSRLNAKERDFFSLVHRAVYANPFSETRDELDLKISGLQPTVPESERIEKAIHEVAKWVQRLERQGRANINHYSGQDRALVETSFLFEFFHQFLEQFDNFILDQIKKGGHDFKSSLFTGSLRLFEKKRVQRTRHQKIF